MTRYLALLRGVNLGPHHKVPMTALRELAESLGHTAVLTHINSGNLIFSTNRAAARVRSDLETALGERFGFDVPVALRTESRMQAIASENPFPDGRPEQVQVAFCQRPVPAFAAAGIAALAADERVLLAEEEIWVDYRSGIGQSKLAARFDAAAGVVSTSRNVRTVRKLVELMGR